MRYLDYIKNNEKVSYLFTPFDSVEIVPISFYGTKKIFNKERRKEMGESLKKVYDKLRKIASAQRYVIDGKISTSPNKYPGNDINNSIITDAYPYTL